MAIDEYRDFVLVADDVEKNASGITSKFTVQVFDSPVGQGEVKETVTLPADLIQQLRWLEMRKLDDDLEAQIKLGEVLAGLLLPEYARQMLTASLRQLRDGQGLRLRLRLADELTDFPWEYIYIQEAHGERTSSGFLALDPRLSIVRHEAVAVPGDWFDAPSDRRVVVAMASPAGYPKLKNLPAEQASLRRTLAGIRGLDIVFLPESLQTQSGSDQGATLKDLTFALMKRTDVFHFSGHGEFATQMGPAFGSQIGSGGIVLAGSDNQPAPASAEQLAETLRGKGVRLVVLGACETGRRDGINVWSGVAAALLKAGIPAVVAMQYTINDSLAAAFSEALYRGLVAGFTIDEAVSLGRAAIRVETSNKQMRQIRDWGAPVLYLRAPGGAVFTPVKDTEAVQTAEQKLGDILEKYLRQAPTQPDVVMNVRNLGDHATVIGSLSMQGGNFYSDVQLHNGDNIAGDKIVGERFSDDQPIKEIDRGNQTEIRKEPKFCAFCGKPLEPGAKFCGQCGTKVTY
jgi:hypothetical protein